MDAGFNTVSSQCLPCMLFFFDRGSQFRIPFLLERLAPPATGITGPFNAAYLSGLKTVGFHFTNVLRWGLTAVQIVGYITGKGGYALVDRAYPRIFRAKGGGLTSPSSQLHELQRCSDPQHL
jgi:hypothetical protein